MTMAELHNQIGKFDHRAKVAGTFEGIIQEIEVYKAADGVVLIDCDGGDYRVRHQKLKCTKCGKPAWTDELTKAGVLTPIDPICFKCWQMEEK